VVEYYEKHFELQDGMDNDSGENWTMCVQTAEPYVVPPNVVGKMMAICKLKNGKTKEHDQMPAELIKDRGQEPKKVISKIWEEEIIPHEWKYGIICPIHKEGDEMMCDNYRAVTLPCTTYKILVNILYVKLVHITKAIPRRLSKGEVNC